MEEKVIRGLKTYIQQLVEISDEEIVSFVQSTTKVTYKKGVYFSTPDKPYAFIGFVAKGLFRSYVIDKEGKEVVLDFVGENNIITSFESIIYDQFVPVYIQAIENSDVYTMSREEFIQFWKNDAKWKECLQKQTESAIQVSKRRYMSLLVDDAKTRYLNFLNDYKPFANRIKLAYVASFLGILPETLSRIRSSSLEYSDKSSIN